MSNDMHARGWCKCKEGNNCCFGYRSFLILTTSDDKKPRTDILFCCLDTVSTCLDILSGCLDTKINCLDKKIACLDSWSSRLDR